MKKRGRPSFWLFVESISSAGLIGVSLSFSVDLFTRFTESLAGKIQYGALAVFFEMAKDAFFVSGVRARGARRRGLLGLAVFFAFFSLAGSVIFTVRDSGSQSEASAASRERGESITAEISSIDSSIAVQERIITGYDSKYKDYATVVAQASAEVARLRTSKAALLEERAALGREAARDTTGGNAFDVVARLVKPENPAATSAALKLGFLVGIALAVEAGGFFLLGLSIKDYDAARGVLVQTSYIRTPSAVHIVASIAGDTATTKCGRSFRGGSILKDKPEGTLCPMCEGRSA